MFSLLFRFLKKKPQKQRNFFKILNKRAVEENFVVFVTVCKSGENIFNQHKKSNVS